MTALTLDAYRDLRDQSQEGIFTTMYDNPWTRFWWGASPTPDDGQTIRAEQANRRRERAYARRQADQGGFAEAVMRIMIAVAGVGATLDKRQLQAGLNILGRHECYRHLTPSALKKMVGAQAHILSVDADRALNGLAVMLANHRERLEAFDIAAKFVVSDSRVDIGERKVLTRIRKILGLDHNDRVYGRTAYANSVRIVKISMGNDSESTLSAACAL